jgi:sulfur transfer complex TusBCD TusB component (DsrH family)
MMMDFSQALHMMKLGDKVARVGWNGVYIYLTGDDVPHIAMMTLRQKPTQWLVAQVDLLAEDWSILR